MQRVGPRESQVRPPWDLLAGTHFSSYRAFTRPCGPRLVDPLPSPAISTSALMETLDNASVKNQTKIPVGEVLGVALRVK